MASKDEPVVFIVDDDSAMREALMVLFEIEQIRTEVYATAEEFLAGYDRSRQCCLVLDVRLPGMSGVDLLDRLASEGIDMPVIVITGHGDAEMIDATKRQGVLKCFKKPFRSEEFLASVRQALSQE